MSLEMGMAGAGAGAGAVAGAAGGGGRGGGGTGGWAAFCDVFVVLGLGTCSKSIIIFFFNFDNVLTPKTRQFSRNKMSHTLAGLLECANTDGTTRSLSRVVCPVRSKSSILKWRLQMTERSLGLKWRLLSATVHSLRSTLSFGNLHRKTLGAKTCL